MSAAAAASTAVNDDDLSDEHWIMVSGFCVFFNVNVSLNMFFLFILRLVCVLQKNC